MSGRQTAVLCEMKVKHQINLSSVYARSGESLLAEQRFPAALHVSMLTSSAGSALQHQAASAASSSSSRGSSSADKPDSSGLGGGMNGTSAGSDKVLELTIYQHWPCLPI